MKSTHTKGAMITTTQATVDRLDAEAQKNGSLYATVEEIANRARLITNLEALMQFGLAQRVRRGDTLSTIHLAILPDSAQLRCWEASLENAGFPVYTY